MSERILPILPPHIRDAHIIEPSDCNRASLAALVVGFLGLVTTLRLESLDLTNQNTLSLLTVASAGSIISSIKFMYHGLRIKEERARETSTKITRARLRNLFAQPQTSA